MARVLVCVTKQTSCERLIRAGARFVIEQGGTLSVVHVAPKGANFLDSASEGDALDYLYDIAKKHGADMAVLRADDTVRTLVKHARDRRITHIIVGVSPAAAEEAGEGVVGELTRQLKQTQVISVPA